MPEKQFSLKDQLFNQKTVEQLARYMQSAYRDFAFEDFVAENLAVFPHLELKERITCLSDSLKKHLPADYKKAVEIILKALPPELDNSKTDDDFGEFIIAPLSEFVAQNGCIEEYYEISMNALFEITKRFSCEDAIRYFINAFPKKTYEQLQELAKSKNYHQRRLVSEGTRLSLPWSKKIGYTKTDVIPLLDMLYTDPTRYVTRSVANSMNDISKVDADLVIKTLKKWKAAKKQAPKEMQFIIKHSLRTLLKQGNEKALAMLGYTEAIHITVKNVVVQKNVSIGENLAFSFTIETDEKSLGKLRIEYAIYYMKANGKQNPKVFKMTEADFSEHQKSFEKKHSFKEMTTRKHYNGEHALGVIVNGKEMVREAFEVTS